MPTLKEMLDGANQHQKLVDFGAFKLLVNTSDGSGARYRDQASRDEFHDPLMKDLIARVKPMLYLDLGANFGFTALLHHHLNPDAAIVAVEMSPLLVPFIQKSFEINNVKRGSVVHAACGEEPGSITTKLNAVGSADNRVVATGGKQFLSTDTFTVGVVSVDQLLADVPASLPFMIKIDTQGYERQVFAGAQKTLSRSNRWIIKTEFGPDWLQSQSTDPKAFLRGLVEQFDVAELPQRSRFKGDTLTNVLNARLSGEDVDSFVDWLSGLALHGRGWCDLLIAPKNRTY